MLTPFGVGVSKFVWVLGRPVLTIDSTHVSLFRLNDCHLLVRKLLFNLIFYNYEENYSFVGCSSHIC